MGDSAGPEPQDTGSSPSEVPVSRHDDPVDAAPDDVAAQAAAESVTGDMVSTAGAPDAIAGAATAGGRFATTYVPPPPTPMFKNRRRLTPEEAEQQRKRRAIRRRRRRIAGLVLAGAGSLILLAAGWVAWHTYQAYDHLQAASGQVSQLQQEIKDVCAIDTTATAATTVTLQRESDAALDAVSDPVYRAASHLPWVGPNLRAMTEVTSTVHGLAVDVVPSLVQIAQTLNPSVLTPRGGVIDLGPIERASPLLQKADAVVAASRVRLAGIDRGAVVGPVGDTVVKLWRKLDEASSITGTGARIARLVPPMLGSTGPRTYLIAFQNLAEVRATGGIFGSFAVVRVDDGRITITDRGRASSSIGSFQPPLVSFDQKMTSLYSPLMGVFPQDVNITPDFPTAASTFAKMYSAKKNVTVDGVMATDPVALSYALKGTGPIDVGDGVTLTSSNIVASLLSTVYQKYPAAAQQAARDAFLTRGTTLAFEKVMTGGGNAGAVLSGLKRAALERRVLLWSANGGEQADIAQTSLAGGLSDTAGHPTIGVFLNDGTGAKLDYYLSNAVTVTAGDCQPDGRRRLEVSVSLRYAAPSSGLPPYVTGDQNIVPAYTVRTNVMVFAPVGGGVVSAARDGVGTGLQRGEDRAREVALLTVELKPGAATTLKVIIVAPVSSDAIGLPIAPGLVLTPGVRPWTTKVQPYDACTSLR